MEDTNRTWVYIYRDNESEFRYIASNRAEANSLAKADGISPSSFVGKY